MGRLLFVLTLLTHLSASTANSPVHIFTFHKTDKMNLLDWYSYHTSIFGFDNVHGIDHNSTGLENVINILRKRGVDISSVPSTMSFHQKRNRLTLAMKGYAGRMDRSFLVPLDNDEYIVAVVPTSDGGLSFSTDSQLILDLFRKLPQDGYKYSFTEFTGSLCNKSVQNNHPSLARRITHFVASNPLYSHCRNKKFYLSDGFIATDQGNHFGYVKKDHQCRRESERSSRVGGGDLEHLDCSLYNSLMKPPKVTKMCYHNDTRLGIVHFGASTSLSFSQYKAKAQRTAAMYKMDIPSMPSPANCTGKGNHYCKFLVQLRQIGQPAMEVELDKERTCDDRYFNDQIRTRLWNLNSNDVV